MRQVHLAHSSLSTSCLGFGCVSLTMHDDRAKALRILETALDSGITHFDVARLYGYGQAEGILGEFLQSRRDKVTVATKFGLQPGGAVAKSRKLISIARWVAHRSKFISKLARRATAGNSARASFNPIDAQASLDTSLRELRTDHIDLFLLHECTLDDARQSDLIEFLTRQKSKGVIRAFGPATAFEKLQGDAAFFPPQHTIMQFDSSTLHPNIESLKNASSRDCITFGPIAAAKKLAECARAPALTQFKSRINADLSNPDVVAGFLLRDALARNASGIVLFATTNPGRISANVAAAATAPNPIELQAFREFVRACAPPISS